jgi:hypothetical protein
LTHFLSLPGGLPFPGLPFAAVLNARKPYEQEDTVTTEYNTGSGQSSGNGNTKDS